MQRHQIILNEEVAEAKAQKNIKKHIARTFSSGKIPKNTEDALTKRMWEEAGQGHVFDHVDKMNAVQKQILFGQLASGLDVKDLKNIKERAEASEREISSGEAKIEPIDTTNLADTKPEEQERWTKLGEELIANGKVAALVLAGGQGSRLGSSLPKGMYDIGIPSHKTLFQIHAERIVRLQQLLATKYNKAEVTIPLYVMTSAATHQQTKDFFRLKDFFGLKEDNVIFFQQGTLPAMDFDGKVIMESINTVFVAPDGNGGLYKALRDKKILDDMKTRGTQWVSQYCVDNVLSKLVDPLFIGFLEEQKVLVGCKAVRKSDPNEKVGVIALKNGKPTVVEYSEIPAELAKAKDENGNLKLRASHICVNAFHVNFLEKAGKEYPTKFHIAKKKIPIIDKEGKPVTPAKENGMKFEQFIFDPWEFLDTLGILEVPREKEFAALKNPPGSSSDCPDTSRAALSELHKEWIEAAGGSVKSSNVDQDSLCEISPLVSLDGEGLSAIVKGKNFQMPFEISRNPNSNRIVVTSWNYIDA